MEVMVTLVVIGLGLLGVMRMLASAVASTTSAGTRALVASQARSLAAAMRANPAFWADPAVVSTTFNATGSTVTGNNNLDSQTADCAAEDRFFKRPFFPPLGTPKTTFAACEWSLKVAEKC